MCRVTMAGPEVPEELAGAVPGGEEAAGGEAAQEDRQQEDTVPQVGIILPTRS